MPTTNEQATLPSLENQYPLTTDQIAAYRRDGFVRLNQLATREEIAAYRPAIIETGMAQVGDLKPLQERDTYGKAFLQIWHLCERNPEVARFVLAKRFAKVAADLFGVDVVRLYHDQLLFKEPGGGYTPWHQDQFYIPLDTDKVMTMWMPLVDVTAAMGTMSHVAGSQHEGLLLDLGTSDDSAAAYSKLIEERGWGITPCDDMAAGDATFHAGWTIHCAGANSTDRMREAITILYYADGARILDSDAPIVEAASNLHIGGRKRGELANSEINPIVFDRRA